MENILIIYEYDNLEMKTKKLKNEDMHSEVSAISLDEESESIFISLENRKLFRMKFSDMRSKKITQTPKALLQIEVSSRFVVMLHENHTIIVRDLERKEKLESLSKLRKLQLVKLIKNLDMLVTLNYKKEILVYDLNKQKLISTLQMPNHIKHVICSDFKPVLLVYGDSGFIEIFLALTGDLINRIGPFGLIEGVFFDE